MSALKSPITKMFLFRFRMLSLRKSRNTSYAVMVTLGGETRINECLKLKKKLNKIARSSDVRLYSVTICTSRICIRTMSTDLLTYTFLLNIHIYANQSMKKTSRRWLDVWIRRDSSLSVTTVSVSSLYVFWQASWIWLEYVSRVCEFYAVLALIPLLQRWI